MHKCRHAGLIRCTSSCCFVFLNILFCYHIMLQSTENSRYDQNDSCKVWPRLFPHTLTLAFPSNFSHAGARVNTNTPCSHIYEHTRRQSVFLISKVHGFPQGCWNNGIKKYWRGELPTCMFWCLCLFMYACLHTVTDPIVSSSKGNLKIGVGLQCPALNLI